MAGPCAVVLLPGVWTADDLREFEAWLAESLSPDDNDNWWVRREPRQVDVAWPRGSGPMLVEARAYEPEDADEATCLAEAAGFLPGTEVVLAAAVNGAADHRVLAQLAVAIARRYGGLIDLESLLPVPPPPGVSALSALESGTARREWEDRSRAIIETLPGRWHEIPYHNAGDEVTVSHVVDAELLSSWLQHPLFRMVK